MSKNRKMGLALAAIGFAVLLLGSAGYIGMFGIGATASLAIMGVGTAMIWASVVLIYFVRDTTEDNT